MGEKKHISFTSFIYFLYFFKTDVFLPSEEKHYYHYPFNHIFLEMVDVSNSFEKSIQMQVKTKCCKRFSRIVSNLFGSLHLEFYTKSAFNPLLHVQLSGRYSSHFHQVSEGEKGCTRTLISTLFSALPPLPHTSFVGGQAAWERQTTPSAPSAGSSCSAPHRTAPHRSGAGGESAGTATTRGEEKSRRWKEGLFPKKKTKQTGIIFCRIPCFQHAVRGWASRRDYCAGRVAAARLLWDRWERWALPAASAGFLKKGQRIFYWSTRTMFMPVCDRSHGMTKFNGCKGTLSRLVRENNAKSNETNKK